MTSSKPANYIDIHERVGRTNISVQFIYQSELTKITWSVFKGKMPYFSCISDLKNKCFKLIYSK